MKAIFNCFLDQIWSRLFFVPSLSGIHVGFSYDARRNRGTSSLEETISFMRKNRVPSSLMKISTAVRSVPLLPANTGKSIDVHLYVNENTVEILSALKDESSAITWLSTNLVSYLPRVNITTIIFSIDESVPGHPPLLLSALTSMRSALKTFNLDHRVNISISLSLMNLLKPGEKQYEYLHKAVDCIRKWGSFVSVEAEFEGEQSLSDRFISLVKEKIISAASILPGDVPLVLNFRSSVFQSTKELSAFNMKMEKLVERNARTMNRLSWLFIEISPVAEFEEKEFNREKEQIFPSLRRQLAGSSNTLVREIINPPTIFTPATPLTNPVTTTPVAVPTGPFVTVPSNSPVTVLPTNPVTTPITIPPTFPVPPAAIPVTNPVTTPPVTNPDPGTTPVTVPENPPMTNPVTTYPFPPPGGTPVATPVTTPVNLPGPPPGTTLSPVVSGQSWCVAKMGAMETALQMALDYACGIGGADCSSIQQGGPCYNPNTVHDHASFAFNSYFQKNPTPTSCDFGGTAMVTNINPSKFPLAATVRLVGVASCMISYIWSG